MLIFQALSDNFFDSAILFLKEYQNTMTVLFENKYTKTKRFFRETYFYDHFKKSFNVILMLFMAALLAPNLFFAVKSSWHDIISDISVGIGILFFIIYFIAYPVRVSLAVKNEKKINSGSENVYTVSATENKILYHAPSCTEIEISFAKIKKIHKSKNYIMLISQDDTIYAFQKDKFTKGTYDDFIKFIDSKNL